MSKKKGLFTLSNAFFPGRGHKRNADTYDKPLPDGVLAGSLASVTDPRCAGSDYQLANGVRGRGFLRLGWDSFIAYPFPFALDLRNRIKSASHTPLTRLELLLTLPRAVPCPSAMVIRLLSLVYTLWFFEWSASRPSSVTLKSLARLPAGTITRQGTRSRLFNRKALRLDKSPHHGILCNYTLSWSISMVHGNWSPLVIPERISALLVHSRYA